jgi:electron transfer flavoprotein beta subunit
MNIVVLVKQVPDTESERKLVAGAGTLDRAAADGVINELDEFAIEEGLRIAEAHGGEVAILSMSGEGGWSIRKPCRWARKSRARARRRDPGSDAWRRRPCWPPLTSVGFDLVLDVAGSTHACTAVLSAMLAERLGVPQLTLASKVDIAGTEVTVRRVNDEGLDVVAAPLPAVVSVLEKINEPRYPSFKGIMAAKKKPVQTLSLADLGVSAEAAGLGGSLTSVVDFAARPPRAAGVIVKDEGDGGVKAAAFLAERKFI